MAFVPAVNCCRVEMVFSCEGQIVENVYHVAVGATPTPTIMTNIAAAFKTWWHTHLVAMEPTAVSLNLIRVTDLDDEFAPGIEYVSGLPETGSNVTLPAPMNVTVAIKWVTGNRGRSFRGRTYHVQLRVDQYTSSTLNGTNAADLKTNYDFLRTDIATAGWQLSVLSTRHNKANRVTGLVTFITGVSVDPTLDSQRRRLPGRGR